MRIRHVMLILACAVLMAKSARAADPFDPFRPPTIGEMIGRNVEKLIDSVQNFREAGAQQSQELEAARKAFWSQYPNGPRHAATQEAFADALLAKDLYYLSLAAQEGCNGPWKTLLDKLSTIDGGIPDDASRAFCDWVDALRSHFGAYGRRSLSFEAILQAPSTALTLEQYGWYKEARDWSEFVRAGKAPYRSWADVGKTQDPQVYAHYLLQTGKGAGPNLEIFLAGHSFPTQLRATEQSFQDLAKVYGRGTMLTMAEKIMRAPRGTQNIGPAVAGGPDRIVPSVLVVAAADELRRAGWNDSQASACSRQVLDDCYAVLIGLAPADPVPSPSPGARGGGGPRIPVTRPSRRGSTATATSAQQPGPNRNAPVPATGSPQTGSAPSAPTPPSPTKSSDILTNELPPSSPNSSTGSNTVQPNRTAADPIRAEACEQRSVIQAQVAATNRERFEAERKMNPELSAYRQELARQHVPAAEAAKRYNEKREALKESYGVNALDQRTTQLGEQLREAQRTCTAAVTTSPGATAQARPQPPQSTSASSSQDAAQREKMAEDFRKRLEEANRQIAPKTAQPPQRPKPVPAVNGSSTPRELSASDIAGIKAAVGSPVVVTGTVARVEQRATFPGSNSIITRVYFTESPDIVVYVIPTFTPQIFALRTNPVGQKITVRLDRLYATASGPLELRIEHAEDLTIGDPGPSPPSPIVAIGGSPGPGRSPTTGAPAAAPKASGSTQDQARIEQLIDAAADDDLGMVKSLLKAGVNVNGRSTKERLSPAMELQFPERDGLWFVLNETALIAACANYAFADTIKALLDAHADTNAVAEDGTTALMEIVTSDIDDDDGVIQLLVSAGAKVDARNEGGLTALMLAARAGNPDMIKNLIAAGADVNAIGKLKQTSLLQVAQETTDPKRFSKSADVAKALLAGGATVNARGLVGVTALHLAAQAANTELVKVLIAAHADVNASAIGETADTPLSRATKRGHKDVIEILKKAGAK